MYPAHRRFIGPNTHKPALLQRVILSAAKDLSRDGPKDPSRVYTKCCECTQHDTISTFGCYLLPQIHQASNFKKRNLSIICSSKAMQIIRLGNLAQKPQNSPVVRDLRSKRNALFSRCACMVSKATLRVVVLHFFREPIKK
jgi:hypothetical protein